jgi:hypothetical protein
MRPHAREILALALVSLVSFSAAQRFVVSPKSPTDCVCTALFAPVCCRRGDGTETTAGNKCECTGCGADATVVREGECEVQTSCECTNLEDPVCCYVEGKPAFVAQNACICKCEGAVVSKSKCKDVGSGTILPRTLPNRTLRRRCDTVKCKAGSVCSEKGGGAKCVPIDTTPSTCAATLCVVGSRCIEDEKLGARCELIESTTPPPTAPSPTLPPGCAAIHCVEGSSCVADGKGNVKCVPFACECPQEFAQVCCREPDGSENTVASECECTTCGGKGTVVGHGQCKNPAACSCLISDKDEPVCCSVEGKPVFTAASACMCECEGNLLAKNVCNGGGRGTTSLPISTCANVRCGNGDVCVESPDGPSCAPNTNSPL